jgi:hypothetical protein
MRGGGMLAKRFFDDELSKISIARTNSPVRRVVEEETSIQPMGSLLWALVSRERKPGSQVRD